MGQEPESKRLASIKISNLINGVHRYEFECMASDFADASIEAERFSAPICVVATLTKAATEIFIDLFVETTISIQCDRCLAPMSKRIAGNYRMVFLKSADADTQKDDDDVRLISKNETHIDLTTDIRETLLLAVPMKNVCEQTTCADNDAPIERVFFQTHRNEGFESEWQQKLAEISKKFKN